MVKHGWLVLRRHASRNGLTFRYHNEKGELPRTFKLVIRGSKPGEGSLLGNITYDDVNNNTLSNGMTVYPE